jgi:hypothetical protein
MMTNQVILALVINRLHVCVAFCKLLASCLEMHLRRQMSVRDPLWSTIKTRAICLRHLMSCLCKFDLWKKMRTLEEGRFAAEAHSLF